MHNIFYNEKRLKKYILKQITLQIYLLLKKSFLHSKEIKFKFTILRINSLQQNTMRQ